MLSRIEEIETERLFLASMSAELLRALAASDLRAAQAQASFTVSTPCSLLGSTWIEHRLSLIEHNPAQRPWMHRAIVRKDDEQMVGHISFHHMAPDPDLVQYSEFAAELGYTIEPAYRRQGYARESAIAMMQWAKQRHGVRDFIICVSPNNGPSLALAQVLKFAIIAEQLDDVDGLEYAMKTTL